MSFPSSLLPSLPSISHVPFSSHSLSSFSAYPFSSNFSSLSLFTFFISLHPRAPFLFTSSPTAFPSSPVFFPILQYFTSLVPIITHHLPFPSNFHFHLCLSSPFPHLFSLPFFLLSPTTTCFDFYSHFMPYFPVSTHPSVSSYASLQSSQTLFLDIPASLHMQLSDPPPFLILFLPHLPPSLPMFWLPSLQVNYLTIFTNFLSFPYTSSFSHLFALLSLVPYFLATLFTHHVSLLHLFPLPAPLPVQGNRNTWYTKIQRYERINILDKIWNKKDLSPQSYKSLKISNVNVC